MAHMNNVEEAGAIVKVLVKILLAKNALVWAAQTDELVARLRRLVAFTVTPLAPVLAAISIVASVFAVSVVVCGRMLIARVVAMDGGAVRVVADGL